MTEKLETPAELAAQLSGLATWRHVDGDLAACLNEEQATALLTAYLARRDAAVREAAIRDYNAWLVRHVAHAASYYSRDVLPTPPAEQKGGEHG